MFVLGASSLDDALLSLNKRTQKQLKKSVLAKRGLSLNHFATNARKRVQFYLKNSLKFQQDILWHDVINNSVSNHPSNNNRPLSPSELVEHLLNYRHQILAVVYCQRRVAFRTSTLTCKRVRLLPLTSFATSSLSARQKTLHW